MGSAELLGQLESQKASDQVMQALAARSKGGACTEGTDGVRYKANKYLSNE